ncbi:hypothetical protein ILYODFUR_032942 [Ilyodon furcidens]|uniref:Uncharacterized protein n=1 Tax=Ilyodon furcidens TaxID=33524 RepID=A0ABV0U2L3_9TELE
MDNSIGVHQGSELEPGSAGDQVQACKSSARTEKIVLLQEQSSFWSGYFINKNSSAEVLAGPSNCSVCQCRNHLNLLFLTNHSIVVSHHTRKRFCPDNVSRTSSKNRTKPSGREDRCLCCCGAGSDLQAAYSSRCVEDQAGGSLS